MSGFKGEYYTSKSRCCDYCDRLEPDCAWNGERYNVPCTHSDEGNREAESDFYERASNGFKT